MNRDFYEYALIHHPNYVPEYASFVTRENIQYISNSVAQKVKLEFPNDPYFYVKEQSIRDSMWEIYSSARQTNQIMLQMIINLLSSQVLLYKSSMDTSHLNPHIQNNPEQFGLHFYNPVIMKLNNRRNDVLQFNGP